MANSQGADELKGLPSYSQTLDWPKVRKQARRWQNISRDLSHALSDLFIAEAVAVISIESLKKNI